MHIDVIIQARVHSTRLPGKSLLSVHGKTFVERTYDRCSLGKGVRYVGLAIPEGLENLTLKNIFQWPVIRGPEYDVLGRYVLALDKLNSDFIIRVTADCPFIDCHSITKLCDYLQENPKTQYTHIYYVDHEIKESGIRGLECEAFSRDYLRYLDYKLNSVEDSLLREHLVDTPPQRPDFTKQKHNWTLDTAEDLRFFLRYFVEKGEPPLLWKQILEQVESSPQLLSLSQRTRKSTDEEIFLEA